MGFNVGRKELVLLQDARDDLAVDPVLHISESHLVGNPGTLFRADGHGILFHVGCF
jgi:hypothetical protein